MFTVYQVGLENSTLSVDIGKHLEPLKCNEWMHLFSLNYEEKWAFAFATMINNNKTKLIWGSFGDMLLVRVKDNKYIYIHKKMFAFELEPGEKICHFGGFGAKSTFCITNNKPNYPEHQKFVYLLGAIKKIDSSTCAAPSPHRQMVFASEDVLGTSNPYYVYMGKCTLNSERPKRREQIKAQADIRKKVQTIPVVLLE
jgi:hypothetical protein